MEPPQQVSLSRTILTMIPKINPDSFFFLFHCWRQTRDWIAKTFQQVPNFKAGESSLFLYLNPLWNMMETASNKSTRNAELERIKVDSRNCKSSRALAKHIALAIHECSFVHCQRRLVFDLYLAASTNKLNIYGRSAKAWCLSEVVHMHAFFDSRFLIYWN